MYAIDLLPAEKVGMTARQGFELLLARETVDRIGLTLDEVLSVTGDRIDEWFADGLTPDEVIDTLDTDAPEWDHLYDSL